MRVKLQTVSLLVLLPLLASASAMSARIWAPGVSSGDYFTYQMFGVYTSNRSNSTIPIPQFESNTTDWVRINITDISGSIVHQVYTLHYINGNETTFNFRTDLNPENQGVFKISEKGVPICAANLTPGDHIPTAELTLNETTTRAYRSSLRETNHASWNVTDDWGNIYFDRGTGMLVELCRTHIFANTFTGEVVEKKDIVKLIDTNRWQIESQPQKVPLFLFPATTIFALLSISVGTHKLTSRKTRDRLS